MKMNHGPIPHNIPFHLLWPALVRFQLCRDTHTQAPNVLYQIWYKNVIFCALNAKGKNAFNRCLSWDDRKCFQIIRFGSCLNCAFFVFLSFFRLFGCLFVCFWDCCAINLAHYPILWTKSTFGFYDACRMYKNMQGK